MIKLDPWTRWTASGPQVLDKEGKVVATCSPGTSDFEQARLMAAAPLLLHTLKDLVKCIRNFELGDFSPLMDEIFEAEHAIGQAEGEDVLANWANECQPAPKPK